MNIGITGTSVSGKDTVAEILIKKGFSHYSLSDIIKKDLKNKKEKLTRENQIKQGNKLRLKHGSNILAKRILKKLKSKEKNIITSIRNTEETNYLKNNLENFFLIYVDAPPKVRYRRILKRKDKKDDLTYRKFILLEKKEMLGDKNEQQLLKVKQQADLFLINNIPLNILIKKVDKILNDLKEKIVHKRPDWDEYFIKIAETVALRSNCLRPAKGAIIVKDKRIVSTGYNGTPTKTTNCIEGGCQRCRDSEDGKIQSGTYDYSPKSKSECVCCHAEENAIVHAAKNGISTNKATLYTTHSPCTWCAKMIINAGIVKIIAKKEYPSGLGTGLLEQAGVELLTLNKETETYENM